MLKEGCMASYSDQPEMATEFRFTRVMAEQAARARLTLDDDQLSLIARPGCFGPAAVVRGGYAAGLYVWGRTGRGKVLSSTTFLPACPLAARGGVHFHHFFRELHQRLNAPGAPDLQAVMRRDDFRLSPAVLRRISSSRPWRRDADQGLTGASLSARYCAVGDVKLSAGDAAAQSAVSRSLFYRRSR